MLQIYFRMWPFFLTVPFSGLSINSKTPPLGDVTQPDASYPSLMSVFTLSLFPLEQGKICRHQMFAGRVDRLFLFSNTCS